MLIFEFYKSSQIEIGWIGIKFLILKIQEKQLWILKDGKCFLSNYDCLECYVIAIKINE